MARQAKQTINQYPIEPIGNFWPCPLGDIFNSEALAKARGDAKARREALAAEVSLAANQKMRVPTACKCNNMILLATWICTPTIGD